MLLTLLCFSHPQFILFFCEYPVFPAFLYSTVEVDSNSITMLFSFNFSRHYLLFFATTSMNPRFMSTVDENLNPVSASVRFVLFINLSIHLNTYLSIDPSEYVSIFLFIYLSMYLSIYVFIYVSIYLSIHLPIYAYICLSHSPPLPTFISICISFSLALSYSFSFSFVSQSGSSCGDCRSGRETQDYHRIPGTFALNSLHVFDIHLLSILYFTFRHS